VDQISLLELWWGWCEDRPKMHYKEFVEHYGLDQALPMGGSEYAKRLFRELNCGRSADASSISFAHWATGMVRFCSLSYDNELCLAFRLMSRSGGGVDALGSLRADCAPEDRGPLLAPGLPRDFDAARHLALYHESGVGSPGEAVAFGAHPIPSREATPFVSSGDGGGKGPPTIKAGVGLDADVSGVAVEPPSFDLHDLRYALRCTSGSLVAEEVAEFPGLRCYASTSRSACPQSPLLLTLSCSQNHPPCKALVRPDQLPRVRRGGVPAAQEGPSQVGGAHAVAHGPRRLERRRLVRVPALRAAQRRLPHSQSHVLRTAAKGHLWPDFLVSANAYTQGLPW